jgi:hypothetical protein
VIRRLLVAAVLVAGGVAVSAQPAGACTPDACPRGPFCPYVAQLCLNPF